MTSTYGYAGKVATVDLTSGRIAVEPVDRYPIHIFLGGRGLAQALLDANLPPGVDPLGESNVLVFAPGALVGTNIPSAGRWSVAAKSPLTGLIGSGNAGGYWGLALKQAGFDALVIKGQANEPCYLNVRDGEITINRADGMWGLDTREVVPALRAAHGDPHLRVAAVGVAGERLVPIANIIAEERSGGRGGLGAVMGSKKLKAIAVSGTGGVRVADPARLNELAAAAVDELRHERFLDAFRQFGSTAVVAGRFAVHGGLMPYNGQRAVYPYLDRMHHRDLVARYILRSNSCAACPVGCLKVFEIADGPYSGTWGEGIQAATFEGSAVLCVMSDMAAVLRAHALMNSLGLDLISTQGVIGFAIECYQKGIIGPTDTNGLELSWGNDSAVLRLVELIGRREGFGALLGLGVRELARRWGPEAEWAALHVKGLEMTQVDPRAYPTWALGYAISRRGADHMHAFCITDFGDMPADTVTHLAGTAAAVDRFAVEGKGRIVAYYEEIRALADCLGLCKFVTRNDFGFPERLVDLVQAALGRDVDADALRLVGERLINAERLFNLREGLTVADDTLPPRMLREPIPEGPAAGRVADLAPMLEEYYAVRQWDRDTGWPTDEKLSRLGLNRSPKLA